ncbi:choice-of-anchor D domain-containing protein [Flavobacterium sp. RHBU_24]|uniref:choice-of-anchor D domain-containing protein n=1 Tax=Flavobacterium sp. RHBU_24 TaxID=3391185 RepID=UPI00398566AB
MFKKRFFLALALAIVSFGTIQAGSTPKNGILTSLAYDCTGGGNETFTNIGAASSGYSTRTWTGDNGVAWSATDARTDQTLSGAAIAIRTSTLKNTSTVTGGAGTVSFKYKRVFTGNSTLKLYVNNVQYGGDITVSSETATTFTYAVNVPGNVVIELRNSGNRTIIDDLAWTCYAAPVAGPELQLTDASNANVACGALTVDFGAHSTAVYTDAIFNIKNTGTSTLTISALTLSNTTDFTVISPSTPLSISASGSAIVLVRFDAVTAGAKTGTLTIVSDDTDEASCVVNLTGTGLDDCTAPAMDGVGIAVSGVTPTTADVVVSGVTASNYLVILTNGTALTGAPVNGTLYNVGDSLAGGTVAYNGTVASFTLSSLLEDNDYNIFVFPYNNAACANGPVYATTSVDDSFDTPVAPCVGGNETFTNIPASSSAYAVRTWTGDNGTGWTADDARTDQTLNGKAIGLRASTLQNTTLITTGIGTLTFNYKRIFTGNSTLKVYVNGVQYGGDITVSLDTPSVFSAVINIADDASIEIVNSGNRIAIDDIAWDCYAASPEQELQLLDSEGALQTCGDFVLEFAPVGVGTDSDVTFTIQNTGLTDLEVSALTLSDLVNYTIVSPATIPFTVGALDSEVVTVRFNTGTEGTYPATLTIESNDSDEAECVAGLTATALFECVAPLADEGVATISNETDTAADVAVTGVTAHNYIAVISEGGTVDAPVNGTTYIVGDTLGAGTVAYVGNSATFTISGLDPETTYGLFIYAYNNTNCVNGPVYAIDVLEDEIATTATPCVGGGETFANIPASSTAYTVRTWTGDNGIGWTASDARTDQTLNGKAIGIKAGTLENTTLITGGIGTLTFNYKRIFTGNSTLKVYVNGVQYGGDITVSLDTPTVYSEVINVSADATIEIVNSTNRIAVDDIAWDCYSGSSARKAAAVATVSQKEVALYPNPSNGRFQVQLAGDNADVAVYNMAGSRILDKKVNNNETIDLSAAAKGIYLVVVTSGETVVNKKIVVE